MTKKKKRKRRPMFFLAQMLHTDQYSKALAWPGQWKLELELELRETLRACFYGQPFCRKRNILVDICKIRLLVQKFSVDMLQNKAYQNLHFSNCIFEDFCFQQDKGQTHYFFCGPCLSGYHDLNCNLEVARWAPSLSPKTTEKYFVDF